MLECPSYRHVAPASGRASGPWPFGWRAWIVFAAGGITGCFPEQTLSSYTAGTGDAPSVVSTTSENRPDSGLPEPSQDPGNEGVDGPLEVPDAAVPAPPAVDAALPRTLRCRPDCVCERAEDRDYMFCSAPVAFAVASQRCADAGGTLPSVDDPAQNQHLTERMQAVAVDDFWLSGTDVDVEGVWRWFDGRVFFGPSATALDGGVPYAPWEPGQPNDVNDEDCMRSIEGVWRDLDCADEIAYACQG